MALLDKNQTSIKDHFVICNWSNKADIIIRQLHNKTLLQRSDIIVITKDPSKIQKFTQKELGHSSESHLIQDDDFDTYKGVYFVIGDPADEKILLRANIQNAKAIIVLVDEDDLQGSDAKAILITLAIDKIAPNVHLIVEILKSENAKYFSYTHADEVICVERIGELLLAQSALTPGLSKVYLDILTQSDTCELYLCDVPEMMIGKTYESLEDKIEELNSKPELNDNYILLGFLTIEEKIDKTSHNKYVNGFGNTINEKVVYINPKDKNYILKKYDELIILAYDKPNLNELFNEYFVENK